ncbi:hypothetical protein BN2537_511 [Streptomyces venezuelae]|nr:hypothetical protein BN2537_511 [Streptomyces venezuelae]
MISHPSARGAAISFHGRGSTATCSGTSGIRFNRSTTAAPSSWAREPPGDGDAGHEGDEHRDEEDGSEPHGHPPKMLGRR